MLPARIDLNSGKPDPAACLQKYLMMTADTIASAIADRKYPPGAKLFWEEFIRITWALESVSDAHNVSPLMAPAITPTDINNNTSREPKYVFPIRWRWEWIVLYVSIGVLGLLPRLTGDGFILGMFFGIFSGLLLGIFSGTLLGMILGRLYLRNTCILAVRNVRDVYQRRRRELRRSSSQNRTAISTQQS